MARRHRRSSRYAVFRGLREGAAAAPAARSPWPSFVAALVSVPAAAARLHPDLRDRRHHRRADRHGRHRHGRRARPDRHRRGRDHRADRRRRPRRAPGPGVRRPRPDRRRSSCASTANWSTRPRRRADARARAPPGSRRSCGSPAWSPPSLLAGFVSFYASANPDGLEKVATDRASTSKAEDHAAADSPLADYGVKDVDDARLSGGLAGVIGVGVTVVARQRGRSGRCAGAVRDDDRPRRRDRDERLTWAPGTPTGSTGTGTRPCTRLPPHMQARGRLRLRAGRGVHAARGGLGVRAVRRAARRASRRRPASRPASCCGGC